MDRIFSRIGEVGLMPVVALDNAEHTRPLCEALERGGLPLVEITFRTAAAERAIRAAAGLGRLLVAAGTVLSVEQVDRAIDAGAKLIVSPGFGPKVVERCLSRGVPVAPGVSTPTEIQLALDAGLDVVKFFPAEALGGIRTLQAIAAPYSKLRFIPTGGIDAKNLRDYLALPSVLACGGSFMVKKDLIAAGRFDEIQRLTSEAVAVVRSRAAAHS